CILLLAGLASRSAVLLAGGLVLRRLTALILRGGRTIGRLPRFGLVSVVLQAAHQFRKTVAQSAGQAVIGRTHGDAQLTGSFTQANLHAVLIFVGEAQRDVFH